VSNVLNEQTKQQVIALGRLGWSLRRIQKATGVRQERSRKMEGITVPASDPAEFGTLGSGTASRSRHGGTNLRKTAR
jgi:hypothetical protein